MIGFLFFLASQPISRKTECRVNLRYVQVVYMLRDMLAHATRKLPVCHTQ